MKKALCSFILLAVLAPSLQAHAGQLFPPEGITPETGTCPDGHLVAWTGNSLKCQDPLAKLTITCPTGQYLAGINLGKPVCKKVETTTGGATLVYQAGSGRFGYCRDAWGSGKCAGSTVTCSSGTLRLLGQADDTLAMAEDESPGKFIYKTYAHIAIAVCYEPGN